MSNGSPIGIFDSGLGGLSVAREIRALLPAESLLYVADSHYAPYGEKNYPQIIERSLVCSDFLVAQGAKAIVVACNTATAAAVATLRARYQIPIIAMEPAVKPAAVVSRSGVIGVLATSGTLKSERFELLIKQHAGHVRVLTQPCTGLVEEIEKGDFNSPRIHTLLQKYIRPLFQQGVDTLILGCTHYPLIRAQIEAVAGCKVRVIDSGAAVAQHLQAQLSQHGLLSAKVAADPLHCWSSGDPQLLADNLARLWPPPFQVAALPF